MFIHKPFIKKGVYSHNVLGFYSIVDNNSLEFFCLFFLSCGDQHGVACLFFEPPETMRDSNKNLIDL